MTITEFLLARIAEDEHGHRAWTDGTEGDQPTCYEDSKPYPCRVIAECEAKRRIVQRHGGKHWCPVLPKISIDAKAACPTLCDLALPYVNHADYRESWRPSAACPHGRRFACSECGGYVIPPEASER